MVEDIDLNIAYKTVYQYFMKYAFVNNYY